MAFATSIPAHKPCSEFLSSFKGFRPDQKTSFDLKLGSETGTALSPHHSRYSPLIAKCNVASEASTAMSAQTMAASLKSGSGMSIVFVSSEVAPWSKTGGLGDVASGLPPALAARGHRVMTIAPRYDQYKDAWDTGVIVDVKVGDRIERVRFFHSYKKGVDRVFVDHPCFLAKVWGQTGSKLYGPETGEDYIDNQFRFALFNKAAIEAPRCLKSPNVLNGPYGENVIFVCNDWHSALLPSYLKANYKSKGIFNNAKVAFCIHNIAYQGRFPFQEFSLFNLPDQFKCSFDFKDGCRNNESKKDRELNWMKAGILESDIVLTVSPNYASEIVSGKERGVELDTIIRKTGITGIVNGMDIQEWDPSSDKYLELKYNIRTVLQAKPSLKEALQAEVGLPVNPNIPVFGFIGRLEEQKGSDILVEAVNEIVKDDVQLILLGTGKKSLQKQLEGLEMKFPKKARGIVKFNQKLGHMIMAGADFMLVPSRFEPCGLIQLYAMRYGTVPVVAPTGGLVDTVKDGVTGFFLEKSFNTKCEEVDPRDVETLVAGVRSAVKAYRTPPFNQMVKTCMSQDWSWKEPAKKWETVLARLAPWNETKRPSVNVSRFSAKQNVMSA